MDASQYAIAARHLMAAKMYSLASCVMLFYDMFLTFGDEVDKIWKQPFTGVTILWFLNRYLTPLGYTIIIVSFQDPNWGPSACDRYVRFPEILKIFSASAVGAIFILRLYAVYARNRGIFLTFATLLLVELAVKVYSFTGGIRLQLPTGLDGCILTGKPHSERLMATWVTDLVFGEALKRNRKDTCVFFAMLYRTMQLYNNTPSVRMSSIVHIMLRDGIIYFAVIFVSNLVTVLIYAVATPDLRVINASFSTLITTLMVSRLMLNLRRCNDQPRELSASLPLSIASPTFPKSNGKVRTADDRIVSHISMSFIGNLGQPVMTWKEQDSWRSELAQEMYI